MGLAIVLIVLGILVLALGWMHAHPKPVDEPLESYVEDAGKAVLDETKTAVDNAAAQVKDTVKKTVKKK